MSMKGVHEMGRLAPDLAQIIYQMRHAANIDSGTYLTTAANTIEIRIEKIAQVFIAWILFRTAKKISTTM
jgi:hypothetical protein